MIEGLGQRLTATSTPPPQDSSHFANEQRKMAAVEAKLAKLRAAAAALSPAELAGHRRAADALIAELEAGRDLSRVW